MSNDSAVIERLQALATSAAPTAVAPCSLAADVLRRHRTTGRRQARRLLISSIIGVVASGAVLGATQLGHRAYVTQFEPSQAMSPTIAEGESVLVRKSMHAERADVVSYRIPIGGQVSLGRVVAVSGDRISCPAAASGNCRDLVVNGTVLDEPYLGSDTQQAFAERVVPMGQVFILGDNRGVANDSRSFGPIDASRITGVAVRILSVDGARRTIPGAPPRPAPGDTDIRDPEPLPTAAAGAAAG